MENNRFSELFERYYAGIASVAELREFYGLVQTGDHDNDLELLLRERWQEVPEGSAYFDADARTRMLGQILGENKAKRKTPVYFIKRFSAVAAILLLAIAGYYFYSQTTHPASSVVTAQTHDIEPGHAGAVLTLSDGRMVGLDTAKDGLVAVDRGVRVIKENGSIRYEGEALATVFNEAYTDRGRSWPVRLPDGSTAWLNTSSSIRYPVAFSGKERRVEMTGECYFEVKHDDKMPFRVALASGLVIEDVGTAFNVRAFGDEKVQRTTVVEGIVNVSKGTAGVKYRVEAGRQAESRADGIFLVKPTENVDQVVAWKDNRFRFRSASLRQILTEAARWYEMDVQYQDEISDTYTISMSRAVPLSKLLKDLEESGGVHFRIEGNKVTVTR